MVGAAGSLMPKDLAYDVAVVGAGPAGGAAALALAQAGARVLLLEKCPLPRYKTCGGGLLYRAYRMLPSSVMSVVERPFTSVQLNFPSDGFTFIVQRAEPLILMTMRADLDNWLARQARDAGADLRDQHTVQGLRHHSDFLELQTSQGNLAAKFVIAADGAHSPVARACGWPKLPAVGPALEYEIVPQDDQVAAFSQVARFDFDLPDGGYGWVFPKRSHLSVGLFATRPTRLPMAEALLRYLRHLGLREPKFMARHGWIIPLAPRPGGFARGRVLLSGDAAGLADPVMAEGLSHAIHSGRLCAEAILDGGPDPAAVARRYQELLHRHLLPELKAGRFLASCLYHHPRFRQWVFRRSGTRLAEFMGDVVMGRKTYRTALHQPRNYLKALGFVSS
jgi:geranylgeranyl reductase family protein